MRERGSSVVERAVIRGYDIVIEQDEEGRYVASAPALPGCHTQAESLDVLMERMEEAIELCAEEADSRSR